MQLLSAFRISSACSWSTQKTMVLPKRSVFFRKSVRFLAIASVRALSATRCSKSLVPYSPSGISRPYRSISPLRRSPPSSIHGRNDSVYAVGSQESVIDALFQAVHVERITEVGIRVAVVLTQRRCGHANLKCRFKVLQNLTPVAFVACAAAVALVHDDEVKEVSRKFPIKARTPLVPRDCLVGREIHLAALYSPALRSSSGRPRTA